MDIRLLLVFALAFAAAGLAAMALLSRFQGPMRELFERYLGRTRESLERTRNPLSSENFTRNQAIAAGCCALVGVLLAPGIFPRLFLGALFGGLAWFAADRYLDWQWQKYQKEFEEQLPDMVGVVANAVKSSFSVQQALDLVTTEFADPMGAEVTEVLQEIRMGLPFEEALQNWADRLANDDLDILVTALIIQRQTGGNLSEVLENLATTMRERRRIQGQIRTLTTQGRFSGTILTFLPVGLYVVLFLIAPERMGVLFTDPLGWGIIALCITMVFIGSLIVRRIVTLDV